MEKTIEVHLFWRCEASHIDGGWFVVTSGEIEQSDYTLLAKQTVAFRIDETSNGFLVNRNELLIHELQERKREILAEANDEAAMLDRKIKEMRDNPPMLNLP